VRKANDNDI